MIECGNEQVEFARNDKSNQTNKSDQVSKCFKVANTGAFLVTVVDGEMVSINPIKGE
jgi:hypothetical protein